MSEFGLAGYDIDIVIQEPTVATFVAVDFVPGYGRTSSLPANVVRLAFVNADEFVQPNATKSALATLTAECKAEGFTITEISIRAMDDLQGDPVLPQVNLGQIEVST